MVVNEPGCSLLRIEQATSEGSEQSFAQICSDAAVHLAQARTALDGESLDPDQAMAHLDAAISCLQRVSRRRFPQLAEANSTVLEFQPLRDRKSA